MTVLRGLIWDLSLEQATLLKQQEDKYSPAIQARIEQISSCVMRIINALPAEEQQIRDAYEAGGRHEYDAHFGAVPNPEPDLETYITNLKKK